MNWAFPQVPTERIIWMRRLVYLVVLLDIFWLTAFPIGHGNIPADLYQPLPIRDLLHLPQPNAVYVRVLQIAIAVGAVLGLLGIKPTIAGWVVAFGMLDWLSNAYSYAKINHDHLALLVALFVLPLAAGQITDVRDALQRNGWTVRMIQISVAATYFLAAVAKVKEAGWGWASSAVLVWAITRRGSFIAEPLTSVPQVTYVFQWISLIAEFLAPLMLVLRGRPLYAYVGFWFVFHASTFALLSIHFIPTVVCLFAFLPLERLRLGRRSAPVAAATG